MDTNTGEILTAKQMAMLGNIPKHIRPMKLHPTKKQMNRLPPKVGRNEPCPCGSNVKFKKCCMGKFL